MSESTLLRSAILEGGPDGGALPRRRFRGFLLFSFVLHLGFLAWLLALVITEVGPIPPPPLTVRFVASAPPAPRLVPLRDRQEPIPLEAPRPRSSPIPPLVVEAPEPVAREPLRPSPIRVEPEPLPIRVSDAAPEISIVDVAPAPRAGGASRIAPLGAETIPQTGSGEEPELEFLVPGRARHRGTGGGIAGKDLVPAAPAGDPVAPMRGAGGGGGAEGAGIANEKVFAATGLASYFSQRYGVTLTEASRLGSRTSDGARYALLVPALSEAYRAVRFRGRRQGEAGEAAESVQVDADAIVIRYHDGTLHVLAPTSDGLVALLVSSGAGGTSRSKVQEAERALGVLHRFGRDGAKGRAG